MSILKDMQNFLLGYDRMEMQIVDIAEDDEGNPVVKLLGKINTDTTDENPSSYALQPSGSTMTEDIVGNKIYQNSYVFYAMEYGKEEVDKADNHAFLESLCDWIEEQNDGDLSQIITKKNCTAESISVSNAMLFEPYENGVALYQVQFELKYIKEI